MRTFLLTILALFIAVAGESLAQPMAAGKGKFLGNVWGSFGSPPLNYDIYWNQATPENDTKWGSVEGTRGSFNWTRADQIYTYCYNSGYPFKFHNLIWGQQTPGWLASLTDSATIAQEIELWIRTAGEHFISASFVDVVNEPLPGHNPPSAIVINALGGTGATGWDWVIKSFQLARQYWDKHVKLLINEYGIIGNNQATQNYLTIINILMTRGLIDGIGVQGHRFELETADTNTIKSNLDALAATGLPIYISEFDVAPQNTLDDAKQLAEMQRIFPVLWRHPGIKGITFWGYIQGLTWQTNAYLISSNSTERPAMQWLRTFMSSIVSDVAGQQRLPEEFGLSQNYPNPFNPSTFIDYDIPKQGLVSLTVYDVYGRELRTLVNEEKGAGHHTIRFEASDLPSGIYFYRIKAGDFSTVRRLALIK